MIDTFLLHPADHILFFLFGLVLPIRTVFAQRKLKEIRFNARMRIGLYLGNSVGLWLMALIVLGNWWWSERSFSSLGLIWTKEVTSFWSIGIISLFFLIYLADFVRDLFSTKGRLEMEDRLSKELSILPRKVRSYLFFIPLAISAGICEEIVFRGFFISYFINLTGNHLAGQILAITVPALIFGFVHTYQGNQAMVKIVGMAVIFGLIFLLTGSIYLLIILHIAVDLVGGSIGLFFPEQPPTFEGNQWNPHPQQEEE